MNKFSQIRRESRKCEINSAFEKDQARVDRLIAEEKRRRQLIANRLSLEIRRLQGLRRAF